MERLIAALLRRPVAVTAAAILITVLAVVAALRLPIALLPSLAYPSLMVWTAYPDVPPERVERVVTERIEEAVAGTSGVVRITSRSQLGGSLVRIDFGWSSDLELAALEVRQQLDRLGGALPEETERPVVLRIDPSERPILVLAVRAAAERGDGRPRPADLIAHKRLARDVIARRLEQIDGVARVRVTGGHEREIEVLIDPAKLAAYDVDLEQIARALEAANVSLAGGTVQRGPFRYAVEVSGEFRAPQEIAATVVSEPDRPPIFLREIAAVRDGVARRQGLVRLDGEEALLLLVERRPDANTVHTARAVRSALAAHHAEMPDVKVDVVVDESVFVEAAISGVLQALLWGSLLAIGVLFLFLRRLRTLLAVAISVPLSLAITLVLFDLLGVSLNLISLSGLALGIGMLVDNAIVVIENIARLREMGVAPRTAASRGAAEVAAAITAASLTTIAVFLPLTFVEGLAGRLFRDQSLAVVCSLLASLLVALTVVPLLAACEQQPKAAPQHGTGRWLRGYERSLDSCLRHRRTVLLATLGFLILSATLGWQLRREIVPPTDEGRLAVSLALPPDAGLPLVAQRAAALEREIAGWPEVRHLLADLGQRDEARLDLDPRPPYRGDLTLVLADGQRPEAIQTRLAALPLPADLVLSSRPVRSQLESLLVAADTDLLIDLTSTTPNAALAAADTLLAELQEQPELINVERADPEGIPAYRLTLDREAVLRFGAQLPWLSTTIEAAARGRPASRLSTVSDEVPITLRSAGVDSLRELLAERVPAAAGLLPLSTFVHAEPVRLPAVLRRAGQAQVVRLDADLAPGADLTAAQATIEDAFARTLPAGVRGRVGGANEAFRSSLRAVGISLLLSVLLVYLILAAQFESLLQPLVILATVPLAVAGVALALVLTGQSWNLMSLTGCVVLVGIAVNDAIVKVDFINQKRRAGMALAAAVRCAGRERIRPVLMTTLTTALGLLPLILGFGQGAALRAPMAIAVVGGLVTATVLTLSVVPVLYSLLSARQQRENPA